MASRNDDRPVILYFGNDWATDNRTSSHHIAQWMSTWFRIYYVECPGLRAPQRSGRDLKRIGTKISRFLRGTRAVSPSIKVLTLLQIPFHRFAVTRRLNRFLVLTRLRWLMWREGIRRPILWFVAPHLSNVIGHLGERLSVYYCIDDHATLPGVDYKTVRAMDEELSRKADLVFTSAESLLERKRDLNENTIYSPHGVDFAHFAAARAEQTVVPADIASLPHPVVGFFGLIEEWVDFELIDHLAEQRPGWSFLMIGRVAIPADRLPQRPNIHWVGKRAYRDLPAYGKQFDASIIPFQLTEVILHANPIKLREYLAMGTPVVSVSTPEIDKYADVVEVAHSREEFLHKLDVALARPSTPEETRRRMDRVEPEGWDARMQRVLQIVNEHLGDPAQVVDAAR